MSATGALTAPPTDAQHGRRGFGRPLDIGLAPRRLRWPGLGNRSPGGVSPTVYRQTVVLVRRYSFRGAAPRYCRLRGKMSAWPRDASSLLGQGPRSRAALTYGALPPGSHGREIQHIKTQPQAVKILAKQRILTRRLVLRLSRWRMLAPVGQDRDNHSARDAKTIDIKAASAARSIVESAQFLS